MQKCGISVAFTLSESDGQKSLKWGRTSHASCFIGWPKGQNRETEKPLTELQNGPQPFEKEWNGTRDSYFLKKSMILAPSPQTSSTRILG